jgi:hypothetical protein
MTTTPRLRISDTHVWRAATWAAPFTIQIVVGVAIGISWLAGKYMSNVHGFGQFALGAGVTLLLSASVSAVLATRGSSRAHGVAVSIVGSSVVAVVGATIYGFWIIGW